MGKSNAKQVAQCEVVTPHPQHVWIRDYQEAGEVTKFFCRGVAVEGHKHIWDHGLPIRRDPPAGQQDGELVLWDGPFECTCGMSAWLHNGRKVRDLSAKEVRFPQADVMERTLALKAKMDRGGPESLSEEDVAEFKAIADALVEAFKPLVESFQKMAESVVEFLATFLDQLDPETVRELHRLAATYGEHTDSPVETIKLVQEGRVIAEHIIGHDPIPASHHAATDLIEDSLQPLLAPNPSDPVQIARQALAEPFQEPFRLSRFRNASEL